MDGSITRLNGRAGLFDLLEYRCRGTPWRAPSKPKTEKGQEGARSSDAKKTPRSRT